jgi:hypothetical protein
VLREQAPRAQQELLGLKEAQAQLVLDQLVQLEFKVSKVLLVQLVSKVVREQLELLVLSV